MDFLPLSWQHVGESSEKFVAAVESERFSQRIAQSVIIVSLTSALSKDLVHLLAC